MSDLRPDLPRFSRDVRVTGPPAGPTGPWAGVGRPFGGVLDPGVTAGEWPPAGLSHLALGGLLADALRPASGAGSPDSAGSGGDSAASDQAEASGDHAEPTVRDVIREEGSTAATRPSPDTRTQSQQGDGIRLSTREPPTERGTPPERDPQPTPRDLTDASDESADPTDLVMRDVHYEEGATTDEPVTRSERSPDSSETPDPVDERAQPSPDRSASDAEQPTAATVRGSIDHQRPLGRLASDVAAPRTVLRQAARGPVAPTTIGDRTITRLVEGSAESPGLDESSETTESTVEPGEGSTAVARGTADTASGAWESSPVERTMPTVPPDLSGPAAPSAADGADAGGPPTPEVVREGITGSESAPPNEAGSQQGTPRSAGSPSTTMPELDGPSRSAGTGLTFDGPSMTVLQDDPATGDAADTATASSESGHVQRGSTRSTGDAGDVAAGGSATSRDADRRPSPQTRAAGLAPSSDEAVSTLIEGMEPGSERVVRRSIENVVRQPRLIDELYHEIERRRRIERERGGEP